MHQSLIFSYFPLLSGRAGPRPPRPLRIHHLPLELLQLIFQQVVLEFEDEEEEHRTPTFDIAHTLSLVCKSWRNLVLSNPVLWSVIDAHYPEEVLELSLLRAARAPLILYLEPNALTTSNASWKLYRQFHRFASFSSRPRFQLDWSHHSFLFYNLTTLSLDAENRPSYTVFIDILQSMGSLQKLALWHSLPSDVQCKPRHDVVILPHLREFICEDALIACLAFLRYVKSSPVYMELKLSTTSLGRKGGSEALFQAFSSRIRVAPNVPSDPFKIKLYDIYDSDRVCKVFGYLPSLEDPWEEVHIDILLQTSQEDDLAALEHSVAGVMKHLPLGHVTVLHFDVPPYLTLSYAFWMDVFPAAFPRLSRLVLGNRVVHSLFTALETFFKTEHGDRDVYTRKVEVPLPRVKQISCDFSAGFSVNLLDYGV
ncbi:hypothetical protein PLEOSDRAFT_1083401 [Pleurotus ostreatus PC15]|uniref:F-box domain-containing protein n=1 Tax=Pleurotus ostreatus (strain PC15) TaxID=1137138 RepID=A0A067NP87_PLEO1|nr:hypothetical protein PLEOSDRAFT_1083401 [Pleurotus ostreatus PC15]